MKFEKLFVEVEKLGYKILKSHNSQRGIKTTINTKKIIKIITNI